MQLPEDTCWWPRQSQHRSHYRNARCGQTGTGERSCAHVHDMAHLLGPLKRKRIESNIEKTFPKANKASIGVGRASAGHSNVWNGYGTRLAIRCSSERFMMQCN
jgi:hypothetical protein